jgi:hypothetical protein
MQVADYGSNVVYLKVDQSPHRGRVSQLPYWHTVTEACCGLNVGDRLIFKAHNLRELLVHGQIVHIATTTADGETFKHIGLATIADRKAYVDGVLLEKLPAGTSIIGVMLGRYLPFRP